MTTTATTPILFEDDNLRAGDLRNPLYHLLQQEQTQTRRRRKSRRDSDSSASSMSSQTSSTSSSSTHNNKRHFLPESVCQRVEESWSLVSNDIEDLGLRFFLKIFDESPELLTLLPYGRSYLETPPDQRKEKLRQCPSLRVHAIHVMTAVGNIIAGLNDMETVIPSLRSLGKTHRAAGISDDHYKNLFRILSATIREKVGPKLWDEETSEAWELVYFSLASIMSRPTTPLQAEPVTGWHELLVLAGLYLAIFTPFQLAGFAAKVPWLSHIFTVIDVMAVCLFLIDLCSDQIIEALRVKPRAAQGSDSSRPISNAKPKSKMRRRFDLNCTRLRVHTLRKLRAIEMDQWVSWPTTDKIVVGSFIFEKAFDFLVRQGQTHPNIASGLHWIHAFAGLLRLAALSRVIHAVRCLENNLLLRQRVDQNQRTIMRITKLILTLAYVTHVSGCIWQIIARIELADTLEITPTAFFPEPNLLLGSSGVINAYIRSIHFAWTNLAGIGNFDSTPVTTLEVVGTLIIHICGVTLYAIMTGAVVNILEELTSKDNEIQRELAELGTFMKDCNVPPDVQKRTMEGFVMRRLVASSGGASESQCADEIPKMNADIMATLPKHLQGELSVYSRSESIQRRDDTLKCCSADFLFALAGELQGSQVLLPGDYLLEEGREPPRQVIVVESGTLEIEVDDKTIKVLRQGDMIGKPWLLKALDQNCNNLTTISEEEEEEGPDITQIVKHVPTAHSFSEWIDITDGCTSNLKIRALSECRLATGLSSPHDVRALRKRFPKDFAILRSDKDRVVSALQKVAVTRNIVRASMAFKRQLRHSPSA